MSQGTLSAGFGGLGLAFALGIVPFARGALGAGDLKAAMVVGVFVGPVATLKIILLTAIGSGGIAWMWWALQRFRPSDTPSQIPVGVPLALATWALTANP